MRGSRREPRKRSRAAAPEDTTNYSANRSNLGHARGAAYCVAMADVYEACASVLKPGGFLVCVTKDMRSAGGGALRNLSGETIALCEDAGLLYWQRVISLLATVRDSELVMRPSFWQTLHARAAARKTTGRRSSRTRTCSCSASRRQSKRGSPYKRGRQPRGWQWRPSRSTFHRS